MSNSKGFGLFVIGLLLGALSGAVAALLLAPQSGEETRTMIKDKSIELRDKAEETVEQARARTDEVVRQLKNQGQSVLETVRKNGTKEPEVEPAV